MGAPAPALAALEVAVAGGGGALAGGQLVGVHGQAHRAARLAPVEARGGEHLVEPLGLGLVLHRERAGHDHGPHAGLDLRPAATSAAARRSSMRPLVHEPMNTVSTGMSRIGRAGGQAHVLERPGGRVAVAGRRRSRRGRAPTPSSGDDLRRVGAPRDVGRDGGGVEDDLLVEGGAVVGGQRPPVVEGLLPRRRPSGVKSRPSR